MATIIRANGTTEPLTDLSLPSLQKAVGGYIEGVRTHQNHLMFINEDGKRHEFPINVKATRLYRHGNYDAILGDAVLLTLEETQIAARDPEEI